MFETLSVNIKYYTYNWKVIYVTVLFYMRVNYFIKHINHVHTLILFSVISFHKYFIYYFFHNNYEIYYYKTVSTVNSTGYERSRNIQVLSVVGKFIYLLCKYISDVIHSELSRSSM